MNGIAGRGSVEEEAVMDYIIDDIFDDVRSKSI